MMWCEKCLPKQKMIVENEHKETTFPRMLVFDATCPRCNETVKCVTPHPRYRLTDEEQLHLKGDDIFRHTFATKVGL